MDQKITKALSEELRAHFTDYKVEAIVSGLLKTGLTSENIVLKAAGGSQRPYRKEVSSFHSEILDAEPWEHVFLIVHREGIYDALPEGIFHQPTRGRTEKNKEETIAEIKKHRYEEEMARLFFLPLELEYGQVRILLYQLEEEFEKKTQHTKVIEVFAEHWPILKKLDLHHSYLLLRVIPLIHLIRNDFELVEQSLRLILGYNIKLYSYVASISNDNNHSFFLGDKNLGENTVVGNFVTSGEYDVKIMVGPLSLLEMEMFVLNDTGNVLEQLLDFFLGANCYFLTEILVKDENKELICEQALLGMNSYL